MLDRGSKNYDNYFGRGKKRTHEGEIVQQDIEFLASQYDEFDPIEIAIEEGLPETVTCCCGENFQKCFNLVAKFRGHVQNKCRVFNNWRSNVINLRSEGD